MHPQRREIYGFAAMALLLWVYLALRAAYVPLVHDEIATFFHYIHKKEFLPWRAHWDANNHLLNSGLSVLFYSLFGASPFVLRLASLLSFPVYAFFSWKLGRQLQHRIPRYALWAGLLFAHSLVEFMALGRGYGMSMAWMLGAVYCMLRYVQTFSPRLLLATVACAALALAANLTLTNTVLLIFTLLAGSVIFYKPGRKWPALMLTAGLFGLLLFVAALLAFEMKKRGLLYYGSDKGFWPVTVYSLSSLLAGRPSAVAGYCSIFFTAVSLVILAWLLKRTPVKQWHRQRYFIVAVLLLGNITGTIALHHLLQVNYPEDRTGMYFYYFLVLCIAFGADALQPVYRKASMALAVPLFLLLPHFFRQMNLSYSAQWYYEHYERKVYEQVLEEAKGKETQTGIGGYAIQRLVWAWYNYRHGGTLNLMQTHDFPTYDYDYLLITGDMKPGAGDRYTQLQYDAPSDLCLLQRKDVQQKNLLLEVSDSTPVQTDQEYFNFYETFSDTMGGRSLFADIEFNVAADAAPFVASAVMGITFADGSSRDEVVQLDWLKDSWKPGDVFHHGIYMYRLPMHVKRIVIYLWNIRRVKYTLRTYRVQLYEVKMQP